MGQVFALAKEFIEMPPSKIKKLLEDPIHEVRAGGVSIMDFQARNKKTPQTRRAEIFIKDKQDLIHKATGWALRYAGDKDPKRLLSFLNKYAATMPRVALRHTIEHLDKKERDQKIF